MNTREKIEWALKYVGIDTTEDCFRCKFKYCEHEPEEFIREEHKIMGLVLVLLGVPIEGQYKTFGLNKKLKGDEYEVYVSCKVKHCGRTELHDPDWERFIEEVVSVVDTTRT